MMPVFMSDVLKKILPGAAAVLILYITVRFILPALFSFIGFAVYVILWGCFAGAAAFGIWYLVRKYIL